MPIDGLAQVGFSAPLAVVTGAGAETRQSPGTAVSSACSTPVFYAAVTAPTP